MSAQSFIAVVMVLASTAACSASVVESDDTEEASTSTGAASLALQRDDAPAPLDYPLPSPNLQREQYLWWDLRHVSDELREPGPIGNCAMHLVKIYDPARRRQIDVPVTVCN